MFLAPLSYLWPNPPNDNSASGGGSHSAAHKIRHHQFRRLPAGSTSESDKVRAAGACARRRHGRAGRCPPSPPAKLSRHCPRSQSTANKKKKKKNWAMAELIFSPVFQPHVTSCFLLQDRVGGRVQTLRWNDRTADIGAMVVTGLSEEEPERLLFR